MKSFPTELNLVTTLLIIWLLDKPLSAIVKQLKIDEADLARGLKNQSKPNPMKQFLLLYISILNKFSRTMTLQSEHDEIRLLISQARNLHIDLQKRDIHLALPFDFDDLERITNV